MFKQFSIPSWQECLVIGVVGYVVGLGIRKAIELLVPAPYQKYVS